MPWYGGGIIPFRRLVDAYRDDWVVRRQPWLSATRRRQLPYGLLTTSAIAMTIEASDLAQQLEEQTRLANNHLGIPNRRILR
ncbi:hypothetical protein GCM10011574_59450 [Microbispora bryophytorum]|uniref:Uncharacterized protein n=1 Tax=Microbispora bryophytorum TaxID=1460882 RepID=A0A8H9H991_9ACTN|nr:hypothetical protein GCM10011574_59450 [Microbispora bryophytorum]